MQVHNSLVLMTLATLAFVWLTTVAFGQVEDADNPQLLSRLDIPPVYLRNDNDDSKWPHIIRAGIDEARKYFGNYGPVYVYILGHENGALNSDEFHQRIICEYCERRRTPSNEPADCRDGKGAELVQRALSGRGDAYLSLVDNTEPPFAELVFINPHRFRDPYLYTRGIHEYTHVFQRAFPTTPTWMMEGGAEFFACYLGEKRGWSNLRRDMEKFLENVACVERLGLGVQDMENIDSAPADVQKYYRHLAYDAGAWAFAYMIHKSTSQRISDIPKKFYPFVAEHGWEAALLEHANMDKRDFYAVFREFLKQPLDVKLAMLQTLKD